MQKVGYLMEIAGPTLQGGYGGSVMAFAFGAVRIGSVPAHGYN